ncbi:MAG TPA: KTSC domain-containing protein [Syntrophorhabdaceae bacterium]|nr:KTSC domain-containing protein [Syntrophorhabdaceae bacterium]
MIDFELVRVSSSNLHSVGYDPASQTLRIKFRDGGVYDYYNVPVSRYTGLMSSGSKGSYHANHIKDHYRYRRIR